MRARCVRNRNVNLAHPPQTKGSAEHKNAPETIPYWYPSHGHLLLARFPINRFFFFLLNDRYCARITVRTRRGIPIGLLRYFRGFASGKLLPRNYIPTQI